MREYGYQYVRKFTVVFKPGEEKAYLDKYGHCRCLRMLPRTDLKPWGTREALMEEPMGRVELLDALAGMKKKPLTRRGKKVK